MQAQTCSWRDDVEQTLMYGPVQVLPPLIAATATRYWQQQDWLNSPYRKYTPWCWQTRAINCEGSCL